MWTRDVTISPFFFFFFFCRQTVKKKKRVSYMSWPEIGTPQDDMQSFVDPKPQRVTLSPGHNCSRASDLAEAIHMAAVEEYPESTYAKNARPN